MGDVLPFIHKAPVDFEKQALEVVALASRIMTDVPPAMRVARAVKALDLIERVEKIIVPLSALAEAVGMLEENAEDIIASVEPMAPVVLVVENAGGTHDIACFASVRQSVIWVNQFDIRVSDWLDRLTNEPPRLLIQSA